MVNIRRSFYYENYIKYNFNLILGNTAASKLSISTQLFAKITGTILLSIESDEDKNEKKINIGMNLKLNKRNEEVLNIDIQLLIYNNLYIIINYFLRLLDTLKNLIMFGCILKKL